MPKRLSTVATVAALAAAVPALAAGGDGPPAAQPRYADAVVDFQMGAPQPSRSGLDPAASLGAPDWDGADDSPTYTTLGCGGTLVLRFPGAGAVDGDGPDIRVYEIGGDVEAYHVDVSGDGRTWYPLGNSGGGTGDFDVAAAAPADRAYPFVRITDLREACKGRWPGADIDAVQALNVEMPPSEPRTVALTVDMEPLKNEADTTAGLTGEPMDTVVTVTNVGDARALNPRLKLTLSGKAVSDGIRLEAGPARPRQDPDADFFDIACEVWKDKATCPLGYGDQVQDGKPYLASGEGRAVHVKVTAAEPGDLTVTAAASAWEGRDTKIEAEASRTATLTGPIVGLKLVGTTPAPYGFNENTGLPLHEGNEITLRYAVRNSAKGGAARDVDLDFFTRTGEVVSVRRASGEDVPCERPKATDTRATDCVIGDLEPDSTMEIDAAFRYGRHFMLETYLRAGDSVRKHSYETGLDMDPVVVSAFDPPQSSAVSPGQRIAARFRVANRGRAGIGGAVLRLYAEGFGVSAFKIARIEGCKSVRAEPERTDCTLGGFSAEDAREVVVSLTPVPAGAEGKELGLSWDLAVPGHSFPHPSTANEQGFAKYRVAPRLADLFVAEWAAADDAEPGVPQVMQVAVGNKGTWPQDDVALKLRLNVFDETGARDGRDGHLLRAAALLSDPDDPGQVRQVACTVTGNDAACALGTLAPRSTESVIFEWTSGAVAAGSYTVEAFVGEGVGERGDAALTGDNSLRTGGAIKATGETVADLAVFNSQTIRDAPDGTPQSFDLWVANNGTLAQDNVVFKLEFRVTAQQALSAGVRFLGDVSAVIPALGGGDRPVRRVPCVVAPGTASCALGRLRPVDTAHVFVPWHPGPVLAGAFRYRAFVGEGAGEAANGTLGDNRTAGGAAIVPSRPVDDARVLIEYPGDGAQVRHGSDAYGSFENLDPDREIWLYTFSPLPKWYHLRRVKTGDRPSGTWTAHGLGFGRPGRDDIGYTYRFGVVVADRAAGDSLRRNAAALAALPAGTTVMHEIRVKRVGE